VYTHSGKVAQGEEDEAMGAVPVEDPLAVGVSLLGLEQGVDERHVLCMCSVCVPLLPLVVFPFSLFFFCFY
jgi:hypothetical protein